MDPNRIALAALVLGLGLAGCASHAGTPRTAEEWESRLDEYEQQNARTPANGTERKIEKAATKVVEAHAAKAAAARAKGWMLVAGAHWGAAYSHCTPRIAPETCEEIRAAVTRDASALELSADEAARRGEWEEAGAVYDAILYVLPDRVSVAEKNHETQRAFAQSLQGRAEDLRKQKLLGAAWAMNVRALGHDPMQEKAFDAGSSLEDALRSRAKVALQDVTVDAKKGDRAFGNAIAATIRPRIDDLKPYGPTKDPAAVKATLTMSVVKIEHGDVTIEGVEHRANTSKKKVANPALVPQKEKVAGLEAKLAKLQKAKPMGPKTKKKIELVKKDLAGAKKALAAIPATVKPPATWDLAYREVTRTVEATVRFELKEADSATPVVLELTRHADRTDRVHAGDAARKVAADALDLPSNEELLSELEDQFADGARVIAQARERRIETRLAKAKSLLAAGREDEALHAYVEVMFFAGPEALPADAAAFVARAMERDEVETLVASAN